MYILFVCLRNSTVIIPWKKSLKKRQWNFCFSMSCLEMISHLQAGLPWNHHVAEISCTLLIPLHHPPACWDYRGVTNMADGKGLPSLIYCWKLLYNNFIFPSLFSHQMFPFMFPCSFFQTNSFFSLIVTTYLCVVFLYTACWVCMLLTCILNSKERDFSILF